MKILIEQSKLLNILNYLYVDGIFPFAVITTKKGKLISSQSDKDEFIYRYVQFLPTNFKEISQENESLKIDVEKVKGFISLRNAKDIITIEYPSPTAPNKMLISGGGVKNNIAVVKVDEKEKNTSLPFTMTDGIPHMHGGEVPLDTHVKMDIASFKLIESYASKHGIEFYRYQLGKDKKLRVFVGDVNEIEDTSTIEPTCEIVSIGANNHSTSISRYFSTLRESPFECENEVLIFILGFDPVVCSADTFENLILWICFPRKHIFLLPIGIFPKN